MQLATKNTIQNTFNFIAGLLFPLFFLCNSLVASEVSIDYRESIDIHVGRTVYIAGETIWYKAYGSSNQKDFLSCVLYVELINSTNQHVLGQLLRIENGMAASSMTIPDTLSSGSYQIKAYTNWMRNFEPDYFFSFPVIIYNQYNKNGGMLKFPGTHSPEPTLESKPFFANSFAPGEKVAIAVDKLIGADVALLSGSIGVYKQSPDMYPKNDTTADSLKQIAFRTKLPDFRDTKELFPSSTPIDFIYPIEDIGILYSGRVIFPENKTMLQEMSVRIALEDSLSILLEIKTNADGEFFFLIERRGKSKAYIELYGAGRKVEGNYQIHLDDKFHFAIGKTKAIESLKALPEEMTEYLENEAERVIIQRAFNRLENRIAIDDSNTYRKWPFYGEAQIDVYPKMYFDLPNFEEISREILPRVQFKKSKIGCKISVTHSENGLQSEIPIVLVDGIPVNNYCDIFPLRSIDIEHIEIQSGMRASGTLEYIGLVAIFTSPEYKLEKRNKSQRINYIIDGYQTDSKFQLSTHDALNKTDQRSPNFQNLLYWNPALSENTISEFYTSDENGTFIIDFMGKTSRGETIHRQIKFRVEIQ